MKLRQLIQSAAFGLTGVALSCSLQAGEPLLTNSTSFRIPFSIEGTGPQAENGYAILFGSQNGGPMKQLQRVTAKSGGFRFVAPSDGVYQFAVRMTDHTGTSLAGDGPLQPELEVVVDSTAPSMKLGLLDAGNGQAQVSWQTTDQIVPGSLILEYAEGTNGEWKSLDVPQVATGETTVRTRPGTLLAVRSSVSDSAGNVGQVTEQVVLGNPKTAPAPLADQPFTLPPQGNPVGPSPFGSAAPPVTPDSAPSGPSIMQGTTPMRATTTAQPISSSSGSMPYYPVVVRPGSTVASPSAAYRTVSSPVFNIAYQVDEIGPSGVGAVELYLTEDNGQRWFRYGEDTDLKSPVVVDVRGEGTFGFAIRVRNGVGFSDPPPQPGEAPEIIVTVDQTPPTVELAAPVVRPGTNPAVLIEWDQRTDEPVDCRLEYATSATGPWTPLFDWQPNPSGYEWPIQPNVPSGVYFRLLARDAVGNISTAQSSQPTIIDLKRPRARMLSIETTGSANAGY